jgi:hypothetical protein
MINDPLKMLRGLIVLAPEMNAKVALLNLVDYVDDVVMSIPDDEEEDQIRVEDILNVLAESLVKLHHHVYDEPYTEFPVGGGLYDGDAVKSKEEQIDEFRRILGLMPEKDENKEENND